MPMDALVLDTNIVLDLLVYEDPATEPLRAALAEPRTAWLATDAMREELVRVLAYPQIVKRLTARALPASEVLAAFGQRARIVKRGAINAPLEARYLVH